MDIYFESDKEVISFCENLFQKNKEVAVNWKVNKKWGNQISINSEPVDELIIQSIADSLVYVFISYRLGSIVKGIIQEKYYFSDRHEIEQIHELTEWIVMSDNEDISLIRANKDPVQLLRAIFLMHLRNGPSIHFDSIVQFGMKVFKDDLIHYVGLAIDEFKREEEHQSFINSVREYVLKKEPNTPLIHVLQGSSFYYYNKSGKQLSKKDLYLVMQKEPLYLIGLPCDEWNLAPLVALCPEQIHMYVDDPSEAKTQTILNVFQERVTLHDLRDFPFIFPLKRNVRTEERR